MVLLPEAAEWACLGSSEIGPALLKSSSFWRYQIMRNQFSAYREITDKITGPFWFQLVIEGAAYSFPKQAAPFSLLCLSRAARMVLLA
jgi:hypothetical protein